MTESWVEPVIEWQTRVDSREHHRALSARAERLAEWPPAPVDDTPTDCFRVGREFWIWQLGVGGLQFAADDPVCIAYPSVEVDLAWFEHVVTRSWLPAVYQVWGRQVVHASAAARTDTNQVVAFAGSSGTGKSTFAYGLARRSGWRPIADDTLAFSVEDSRVHLHPLANNTRLRSATAEHFGASPGMSARPIAWPERAVTLACVYFLDPVGVPEPPVTFVPLRAAESYPLLLGQAHAFSLELAEQNQRLMRDYLTLAASVPIVRLRYRRAFADLDRVLDAVARRHAGVSGRSSSNPPADRD